MMIIFLQWYRPLKTNFANNMETFNEVGNLFTLYLLMSFSDFVPDAETRNKIGLFFIVYLSFFALVHICILIKNSLGNIKDWLKKKCGHNHRCRKILSWSPIRKLRSRLYQLICVKCCGSKNSDPISNNAKQEESNDAK